MQRYQPRGVIQETTFPKTMEAMAFFFRSSNGNCCAVEGNSMWPLLKHGQRVDIVYETHTLSPGRCYAFACNGRILVHRFIRMENGKAIFIGDRSLAFETVTCNCIIGQVPVEQSTGIVWVIAGINSLYSRFLFLSQKGKVMRMMLISLLTKGALFGSKI